MNSTTSNSKCKPRSIDSPLSLQSLDRIWDLTIDQPISRPKVGTTYSHHDVAYQVSFVSAANRGNWGFSTTVGPCLETKRRAATPSPQLSSVGAFSLKYTNFPMSAQWPLAHYTGFPTKIWCFTTDPLILGCLTSKASIVSWSRIHGYFD